MSSSSGTGTARNTSIAAFDPTSTDYQAGFAAGQSAQSTVASSTSASNATGPSPGLTLAQDSKTGLIVTGVVSGVLILFLAYYYFFRTSDSGISFVSRSTSFITYSVIILLLAFGSWFIYQGVMGDKAVSGNLARTPIDSSTAAVIPGSAAPAQSGINGGNYGMQWWMYIKDWDTKFGIKKTVIKRGGVGSYNPYVYLGETDNSLVVQIDQHATTGTSTAAPAASQTCSLPNVPLQTWFAVSLSVSGRNVDLYLNGTLLRSCLLPGVPMTPTGSVNVMSDGGFSGNVVDLFHYSRALTPADASAFFAAGTAGTSYTPNALPSKSFFGYSVNFNITDSNGKLIKQFGV